MFFFGLELVYLRTIGQTVQNIETYTKTEQKV